MTVTIELPDNLGAALRAQAYAHGLSEAGYLRTILERNLTTSVEQSPLPRENLAQFLLESPFAGSDLNLERRQDYGRPIDL